MTIQPQFCDNMNSKNKKTIMFLFSIFVGIVFITSLATLGLSSPHQTAANKTTTKQPAVATIVASGEVNATIVGYERTFDISLANISSPSGTEISNALSTLSTNGEVGNFAPTGSGFIVYSGNKSADFVTAYLYNVIGLNNSFSVNATALVRLPNNVTLYNQRNALDVIMNNGIEPVRIDSAPAIGSKVKIDVLASVFQSTSGIFNTYQIYNNTLYLNQVR